jgi:hypothetical protein
LEEKEEIEMMRPNVPATLAGGRVRTLRHAEEQRSPVKKKTIFTDRIEEYFSMIHRFPPSLTRR